MNKCRFFLREVFHFVAAAQNALKSCVKIDGKMMQSNRFYTLKLSCTCFVLIYMSSVYSELQYSLSCNLSTLSPYNLEFK